MRRALLRENVMDAGLGIFREMAEARYERIEITEGGVLRFTP